MKNIKWVLLIGFFSLSQLLTAQTSKIDRQDFFKEDKKIEMKFSTNFKELLSAKKDLNYVDATISMNYGDLKVDNEKIRVKPRGNFRKENCLIASLMLEFRNESSPTLSPLKKLKMVGGCNKSSSDEQSLLKEYLVYKIYNLLTDMSFRVRLINVEYNDTRNSKPYTQHAFLIEDVEDLAKRHKCIEKEETSYHPERTNREQTTLVSIFQYMIGNTDWSIPYYHNIKLLVPKSDTLSTPFVIPYDFDVTGFVNAYYAVPPPNLPISSVTDRLYRGFPRTMEEVEVTVKLFLDNEAKIRSMVNDFELLNKSSKNEINKFIDEFFTTIKNKKDLQKIFVDGVRS